MLEMRLGFHCVQIEKKLMGVTAMQSKDRKRVTAEAFVEGDVYIDYPYEDAKFRFERATLKVYRRFYGEPEIEIPHDSELYHEAQSGGWQITAEEYFQDQGAPREEEAADPVQSTTARTTPARTCSVCGLAPGEICNSALGPTSYARCETCLEEGAESIGVICLRIFLQGGPANVEKTDRGDWWPYGVKSYADGRYIGWPEILAIYPQYEAHFRKN
jgi:hypothetical protein